MSRKTVLVTGASRGIGKAIAIKFARKGYNVVISCIRNEDRLMQTKKEIENYQVPCLAYMGDMGDMDCCKELFAKIKKQFGGIDVLVNNVGGTDPKRDGNIEKLDIDYFDEAFHLNLSCTMYLSQLILFLTAANWRSLIWYTKNRERSSIFPLYGVLQELPVKQLTLQPKAASTL